VIGLFRERGLTESRDVTIDDKYDKCTKISRIDTCMVVIQGSTDTSRLNLIIQANQPTMAENLRIGSLFDVQGRWIAVTGAGKKASRQLYVLEYGELRQVNHSRKPQLLALAA
jgi:hypothetical protein